MLVDLDTFLVALYTLVDDLYQAEIAPHKPIRRGHQPELSDSEVLTLLICAQWVGNSERAMVRYAATYWRSYFPRLISQSAFNRRARDLGGACAQLITLVARELGVEQTPYQVVDTVPVPLAQLCRGKHHRLFANDASIGRGGSDRHFYYGCTAVIVSAASGPITGVLLGPASTEGRWLLDALLCWRADPTQAPWAVAEVPTPRKRRGGYVGPTGPRWWPGSVGETNGTPYIADTGFSGRAWIAHWHDDYGATVFTRNGYGAATPVAVHQAHQVWRLRIETVYAILGDALHLATLGAKTPWGIVTRVSAKCAAFNCGIWLNRLFGRPDLPIGSLFPG